MSLDLINLKPIFPTSPLNDVAVIPVDKAQAVPGLPHITLQSYLDSSMLAQNDEFDGKVDGINIGDQVVFAIYSGKTTNDSNRPILRNGWIASDPRKQLDMPHIRGDAFLTEAFSTRGTSGAPVFVVPKGFVVSGGLKGGIHRAARFVGVNAGHVDAAGYLHANLSYVFKSSVILECLDRLSQP